jgi:nitrogen regulatory protein P-II 1
MKLITAIIQPSRFDQVHEALNKAGITRVTVTRVSGHGRQEGEEFFRGAKIIPSLLPKTRLDIAVNDDFVELTCDTILEAASAGDGEIGDGKIFIVALEECIRIRTSEKGGGAI